MQDLLIKYILSEKKICHILEMENQRLHNLFKQSQFDWRYHQYQNARARFADREARWERLNTTVADHWVKILQKAGPIARQVHSHKPCSYDPWCTALGKLGVNANVNLLCWFAEEAGYAGWPEKHAHLVRFVLTFMEEDPILFRTGYAKKNMAKRLKQADLSTNDIVRIGNVMKKVVVQGCGLEEFKPYCKLAQKVKPDGLWDWLEEQKQHPDEKVRRNARYMRLENVPWHYMSRWNEVCFDVEPV